MDPLIAFMMERINRDALIAGYNIHMNEKSDQKKVKKRRLTYK